MREFTDAGLDAKTAHAFAVLLPVRTVGVMGGGHIYQNVIALRAVTTNDFMTADWARLPDDFLARVSSRSATKQKALIGLFTTFHPTSSNGRMGIKVQNI